MEDSLEGGVTGEGNANGYFIAGPDDGADGRPSYVCLDEGGCGLGAGFGGAASS